MTKRLVSYIDAMAKAAMIINGEAPDYLVAPMLGSVPFIDSMAIVDRDFDPSKVVYMPASSRILDVSGVIKRWYSAFLNHVVDCPDDFPKILGIDEVVSGASVMRCFKSIDASVESKRKSLRQSLLERVHSLDVTVADNALREADMLTDNSQTYDFSRMRERVNSGAYKLDKALAREDTKVLVDCVKGALEGKMVYRTIGIEDSKKEGARNSEYDWVKEGGRVIPVGVESIITMDQPSLVPPRFEMLKNPRGRGYIQFSPRIVDFVVTPEYINFLRDLAKFVGRNPEEVSPVNMSRILHSSDYLSKKS